MPDAPKRPTFDLPDQGDAPVVWDPAARAFVPASKAPPSWSKAGSGAGPAGAPPAPKASPPPGGAAKYYVGADAVGKAPPPRTNGDATAVAPAPGPAAPARRSSPPASPRPSPAPKAQPAPQARARRRLRIPFRRPKLRWLFMLFGLLPLLLLLGGFLYATSVFNRIERVPVADVLSSGGSGTNFLIVGSDSRDPVVAEGSDDPHIQPAGEGVGSARSDTMIILRLAGGRATLLSVPRDLCIEPCRGASSRINAQFNEGPSALIQAVQGALSIPVHHYLEVDFVSFSSLVDALGGVPIEFPNPAVDDASGLFVPEAGRQTLNGQQALAFVRSRNYEEIIGGERVPERVPFPDVARGLRQQQFLRAVFGELGGSRNPVALARSASALAGGLRIDDAMSLTDGIRFAWRIRGLNPETVDITPALQPVTVNGASVLQLGPGADAILDQFRG